MFKYLLLTTSFICTALLLPLHAQAHGDGGHSGQQIEASDVVDLGSSYVSSLVKHDKKIQGQPLDESWLNIAASDKSIAREASWYFVVKIHHRQHNKTLYLMISKKGKLYRANFNGIFKGFQD